MGKEAEAHASMIVAVTSNDPAGTTNTYAPKQNEFKGWMLDPYLGGYENFIITPQCLLRFVMEQLLIMGDGGVVLGSRKYKGRGRKSSKNDKELKEVREEEEEDEEEYSDVEMVCVALYLL
jgi:hypothetical protein